MAFRTLGRQLRAPMRCGDWKFPSNHVLSFPQTTSTPFYPCKRPGTHVSHSSIETAL